MSKIYSCDIDNEIQLKIANSNAFALKNEFKYILNKNKFYFKSDSASFFFFVLYLFLSYVFTRIISFSLIGIIESLSNLEKFLALNFDSICHPYSQQFF